MGYEGRAKRVRNGLAHGNEESRVGNLELWNMENIFHIDGMECNMNAEVEVRDEGGSISGVKIYL